MKKRELKENSHPNHSQISNNVSTPAVVVDPKSSKSKTQVDRLRQTESVLVGYVSSDINLMQSESTNLFFLLNQLSPLEKRANQKANQIANQYKIKYLTTTTPQGLNPPYRHAPAYSVPPKESRE